MIPAASRPAGDFPGAESHPLDYPGARPAGSYLYAAGRVHPFRPGEGGASEVEHALADRGAAPGAGRIAVLAVGSNACPGRLLEKFGIGPRAAVPVVAGRIPGVASVYMPRLSAYAALPATAWPVPGGESRLWVTLLDPDQLSVMDASEGVGESYKLTALPGSFRPEGGGRIGPVYAYASGSALAIDGGPVRLSAFESTAPFPAMDQRQALGRALDLLGVLAGRSIEDRHRALRRDPGLRSAVSERLAADHAAPSSGFERAPNRPPAVEPASWEA